MLDLLHYDFMRNALLAGLLVSVACGVVGSLVVVNRLSSLSGGIAHAAYGGLGLAVFFKWPLLSGAMLFSLAASWVMGYVTAEKKERADTMVGVVWAVGMAFGILMIDLTKGYYADVMSYLFGSILAVPGQSILFMAGLDAAVLAVVALLYKELVALSYDEEFALISGVPVRALYYLILVLIALCVVVLIRVVGLILVIALFTIPASIAELFTRKLGRIMVISCGLGMAFTISGLFLSYYFNLTSGATIILVAGTCYFAALLVARLRKRRPSAIAAPSHGKNQ
ncbi:MAG TPA: metal ABC transporter permease [Chitinivibrionales bacterium]|nr:metal ABC transporter permease [Chitinivibrionales bacterium]